MFSANSNKLLWGINNYPPIQHRCDLAYEYYLIEKKQSRKQVDNIQKPNSNLKWIKKC